MIERSLAHAVKGKTEAAYNRADLLDRRRALMTQWSAFLSASPAQKRSDATIKRPSVVSVDLSRPSLGRYMRPWLAAGLIVYRLGSAAA